MTMGAVVVTTEQKSLRIKQADDEGRVEAVFATLGVVDHDGDVILPGAFRHGEKVRISAYNHSSWGGAMPVGKGTIVEEGNEAVFRGEFFLTTTAGRDTFETVKGLEDLGEWSFGFDIAPDAQREGEHEGRMVRFIGAREDGSPGITTHEVSPVMLGAGINTRTLVAKAAHRDKLTDHLGTVTKMVDEVTERVREVVTMRAEQGKQLGEDSRALAVDLASRCEALREVVTTVDAPTHEDEDAVKVRAQALAAVAFSTI